MLVPSVKLHYVTSTKPLILILMWESQALQQK
jgi:hypothetical protein